jgi:hypothetical protein
MGTPLNVVRRLRIPPKVVVAAIGLLATAWFLIRVIPKPSRATYPCMRATAPLMSGFITYLLGLAATALALKKAKVKFAEARPVAVAICVVIAIVVGSFTLTREERPVYANSQLLLGANQPVGVARGIYPGRVVWVWDSSSTNAQCTNAFDDGWFLPKNTNIDAVTGMLADAVTGLTGRATVADSWDALFRDFNQSHGKGNVGYVDGEKVFIRTNQVSASDNTIDVDYTIKNTTRYGMAETSPQIVLAVLRHLVNECGVKQENVSLGDPMKHMYKHEFDLLHGEFPNVTYLDYKGTFGRTKPVAGSAPSVYYSDRGTILKENGTTGNPFTADYLPTVITEADYLVAIPALKGHARGGVTLCGKLHFGSNLVGNATHLHGGLIAPNKVTDTSTLRLGYGLYRVQVDLMGHKDLGEKTVLFLVDALWGGSEANDPPRKFSMTPFNGDWTSSLFVSQDQLAVESVCFDFLKAEFTSSNPYGSYPQVVGADDYIMQAADSTYWPTTIRYDPELDGTRIGSIGVCEHWNNPVDKQYTRNLGTGGGIELMWVKPSTTGSIAAGQSRPGVCALSQNYPNPFNPSTHISYRLADRRPTSLTVFDVTGRKVATLVNQTQEAGEYTVEWKGQSFPSGMYFCRFVAGDYTETKKLLLQK